MDERGAAPSADRTFGVRVELEHAYEVALSPARTGSKRAIFSHDDGLQEGRWFKLGEERDERTREINA